MQRDDTPSATSANPLELDPIWIPGLIEDLQTEGAVGGVNAHMIHSNEGGLLIIIQAYQSMAHGDWIEVFWGNDDSPVSSGTVEPEHVDKDFPMYVAASRVPEGINELHAQVTRPGGGNGGSTPRMPILVRTEIPGGIDPEPDNPNHQDLLPPEPELPPGGIIDEDAAKAGVKVTIPGYPNMRLYDLIQLSWGGVKVSQEVTQADMDAGFTVILVTEDSILEAGDSDQLVLTYAIRDEVHNPSDGWSMRTYITVEIGEGLFDAPLIDNPNPDADPIDVIDLDELGDEDLLVSVMVLAGGGLLRDDELTLKWVGTNSQDESASVDIGPVPVTRVPGIIDFLVPNADVRGLGQGRGVASYTATRAGAALGASKRSFVTFLGAEQRLPKPIVEDAVGGTLDPALPGTTVIVPGEALEAGDTVFLTWLGTRANGTPVLKTEQRGVSGGGAGQPMQFSIGSEYIAPLDGGSVEVYYRLHKDSSDTELESDRERLQVGEVGFELPAPFTRPASVDGVLDPEDITLQLQLVIPPWPGMSDGQTVHVSWNAGSSPDYGDQMQISAPMEGHEVLFSMDRAKVEEYLGEDVALSYWVETPGEPALYSASHRFSVGVREEPIPLPLPDILEANDNQIDPDDVLDGATVHIDSTARFEEGDQVTIRITSSAEGGSTVISGSVAPGDAGKAFTATLAHEVVDASEGTTFELKYEIIRAAGGPVEYSEAVVYSVKRERVTLPLPEILEAKGDQLDPDDVPNGATVHISSTARLEERDEIMVRVISDASGGSINIPHQIPAGEAGKPASVVVPYAVINANEGTTFELRYEINRAAGGPVEHSETVVYTVKRERLPLPLPVILQAEGNHLDPDDVPNGATVHIDASARFKDNDQVLVRIISSATGGSIDIPHRIAVGDGGKPVTVTVPYTVINASSGVTLDLLYEVTRATGGPVEPSDKVTYSVSRDLDTGPMRIMGARYAVSTWRGSTSPRMLSALHDVTLVPMRVEWRYEGEQQWTARTGWIDDKPWLKLHVRNTNETWECRPANIIGNGYTDGTEGHSVFVAMRDEVSGGSGPEIDMVAWGHADFGGELDSGLGAIKNVEEISVTAYACAARLGNGNVVCWGDPGNGGTPAIISGDFVQVRSNILAFAGRKATGELFAWGGQEDCVPVPDRVLMYRDYIDLHGGGSAFVARRKTGHLMAWGHPTHGGELRPGQDQYTDILEVAASHGAFIALRGTTGAKSVIAWGDSAYGGVLPDDITRLENVRAIGASTTNAFCILLETGGVRAWPAKSYGGTVPPDIAQLRNVVEVTSTRYAFCARLSTGQVVAWGDPSFGGRLTPEVASKSNIVQVVPALGAFAALCSDGTVVAWGDQLAGGNTAPVVARLVNVRAVYANSSAFTALTKDGRVVTWGMPLGGGNSDKVQHLLNGKVTASRLLPSAEAGAMTDGLASEPGDTAPEGSLSTKP